MSEIEPIYKDIEVQLSGEDGNAFAIISRVLMAMKHAEVPAETIKQFSDEAMSGDYDHVLQTCMKYVDCA